MNIGRTIGRTEKQIEIREVILPNLLRQQTPTVVAKVENFILLSRCGDCKAVQPQPPTQNCKCGALLYPF